MERTADCNKVSEDVARLIDLYLGKASPRLLRGSVAYIFNGVLILMQYVKRVCGKICLRIEISCVPPTSFPGLFSSREKSWGRVWETKGK